MQSLDLSRYKTIIFDFDGTLYDKTRFGMHLVLNMPTRALWLLAVQKVRKAIKGKDFSNQEKFYEEFFSLLHKAIGTKLPIEEVRNWYFNGYMPLMHRVLTSCYECQPEANELIKTLTQKGIKVAVLSDYAMIEERLKAIGITAPFDFLYSSETAGALKPSSRPFSYVAQALGIEPKDILMIGDREDTDGQGAANADMDFMHIVRKKKQKKTRHDATWADLSELIKKL
ncbi:MAG: HAD family hydrolase [Bacteroidia bacterium]|nr:HAD family hydrolase [Bacteroidia bacterium]